MKTLEEQIREAHKESAALNHLFLSSRTLTEEDIRLIEETEKKIEELETRAAKF